MEIKAAIKVADLSKVDLIELQNTLKSAGFYEDGKLFKTVGVFDKNTLEAWKRFKVSVGQQVEDLIEYIGPASWKALLKYESSKSKGSQKESIIKAICEECDYHGLNLRAQKAYVLATVEHETGNTFQPIEEYGKGEGKKYGKEDPVTGQTYYGRGLVQLTWKYNYEKYSKILGIDLVNNPALALDLDNALFILVHGAKNGTFTGKSLEQYVNKDTTDFFNARRCINGVDEKNQHVVRYIAEQATKYLKSDLIK